MSFFQVQIKLFDIAIHASAVYYWEREDVKSKLKEFLITNTNDANGYWLIAHVIKKVDPSCVPGSLYHRLYLKLSTAIKSVGNRIFAWSKQVREFYDKILDLDCITLEEIYGLYFDKIYWKSDYTIDEVRMIKSAWDKNPKISMINKYEQACHYCLVEDIKTFPSFNDIKKNRRIARITHLILYWEHWKKNDLESYNTNIIRQQRLGRDCISENMLRLSCEYGYTYALKYFWDEIPNKDTKNIILFLQDVDQEVDPNPRRVPSYHKKVDSLTNIFFFLSYLSKHFESKEVLRAVKVLNLCTISDLCILFWQCYDDYIPIVEKTVEELKSDNYKVLLRHILRGFRWDLHYYGTPITHSFHYGLFHEIWQKSPKRLKKGLVEKGSLPNILVELCKVHDFSHIHLIINDTDLADCKRKKVLKPNSTEFKEDFFNDEILQKMAKGKDIDKFSKFKKMFSKPISAVRSSCAISGLDSDSDS